MVPPYTSLHGSAHRQPKLSHPLMRDADPEVDHMVAMWKLVRKEAAKLLAGLPNCFKVIPGPRLGVSDGFSY